MQRLSVGRLAQRFAQRLVREHLRELGQDLQVLLGRLLRHEEHERERHRRAVGSIERNRLREANKGAERFLRLGDGCGGGGGGGRGSVGLAVVMRGSGAGGGRLGGGG